MNVSAFNSVNQKLPMKITVKNAPEYKTDNAEKTFCLDAKDSQIETFHITAKVLDALPLPRADSSIINKYTKNCLHFSNNLECTNVGV